MPQGLPHGPLPQTAFLTTSGFKTTGLVYFIFHTFSPIIYSNNIIYIITKTCTNVNWNLENNTSIKKYFDELLERIKTIRVSERMAYQKITDLFIATAADYNPKSEDAYTFFKIVQNKLHYAISGHYCCRINI